MPARHVVEVACLCVSVLLACAEPPSSSLDSDPSFASGVLRRPVHWTTLDLTCPDGTALRSQKQSVYPLDEAGSQVLVGAYCIGAGPNGIGTYGYHVYDLSTGEAVRVDSWLRQPNTGFVLAAHSPVGSPVGFGAAGDALVIFEGEFRAVPLPPPPVGAFHRTISVWAASPTSVWLANTVYTAAPERMCRGQVLHFDGAAFSIEYETADTPECLTSVTGIWGIGSDALYASSTDGILARSADGSWSVVLDAADLPSHCLLTLSKLSGTSKSDVWVAGPASGSPHCLLHYDGKSWASLPGPANGASTLSVWALDARQILLAGQDVTAGPGSDHIALWGSTDAGQTWTQFSDPTFSDLDGNSTAFRGFFGLAATSGGQRIFLPTIFGGSLLMGTPQDFAAIAEMKSQGTASSTEASGTTVLPEDL